MTQASVCATATPIRTVGRTLLIGLLVMLFWLVGGQPVPAAAQEPVLRFERLTPEQGLSQSQVYAILQDRQGFIWIGTGEGLNKYDGYSFTVYKLDTADPTSLVDNAVRSLYEDRQGTLWVGTNNGLSRFDRDTQTFTRYRHDPDDPQSIAAPWVADIAEDAGGTLWFGTITGGMNRFNRENQTFSAYKVTPEARGSLMYIDRAGTFWVGNSEGLHTFDPASRQFTPVVYEPAEPGRDVYALQQDRQGFLWIGTEQGLYRFDRERQTSTHYTHDPDNPDSLSDNWVSTIHEDQTGTLWVGTYSAGLNRFDPESETFSRYQHSPTSPTSISSNTIYTLYEDRTGLLWIGTAAGINIFNPRTRAFNHYTADPEQPDGLANSDIAAFAVEPDGNLWVGTWEGGLSYFDRDAATITTYRHDPADPRSLSHDTVYALYRDRAGMLWVGTYGGGLNRFDPATERFTRYRHDPDKPTSLSNDVIPTIYQDQRGTLWVAGEEGLNRFNPATERFTRYLHDPDDPTSLSHSEISSIYEDPAGTLWVGTWGGGINRFDPDRQIFQRYTHEPDDPGSLSDNRVFSITGDAAGTIWVGTTTGLNRLDPGTERFKRYTENDGLPANAVRCLVVDDSGTIWLSGSRGLAALDPTTGALRRFTARDGLQGDGFNGGSCFRAPDGELFFGGSNGFNAFDPQQLTNNPHPPPPPVVLTGFDLLNEPVNLGQDLATLTELPLSYRDAVISFEFAALDYAHPDRNQYAYKLEGFDADWVAAGTRRAVTYTNLDGGDYTLRVRGANSDGVWNAAGLTVAISVTPAPWQTWWAYSLYALAAVGFVAGYVRDRTRAQARELARQRQELERERLVAERLRRIDRLKEEKFRAFFNRSPIGIGIARDGVILDANPACLRIFGYNTLDAVRDTLTVEHIAPQDRVAIIDHIMRHGEGEALESGQFTLTGLRSDGSEFPLLYNATRMIMPDGAEAVAFFITDMSDLKRAEEERDQFFTLSQDMLCIAEIDGYFKRLNPAWETTLGLSIEELLAEPFINFVHPADRSVTESVIVNVPKQHNLVSFENRYRCKNGTYKWLAWSYTFWPNQSLFYAVARDITAQKRAADEQHRLYQVAEGLRDVLAVINSDRSLADILHFIVGQANRMLGVDVGVIYRFLQPTDGATGEIFRVEAAEGFEEDYQGILIHEATLTICYDAILSRQPAAIADMTSLLDGLLARDTLGADYRRLVVESRRRFRATLVVPLIIKGEVYGTISLYDARSRQFVDEEIKLAVAFAAQSALAIENARLRQQVRQAAVREERGRLARELHDSVTQSLYSLTLLAEGWRLQAEEEQLDQVVAHFARLGSIANQALREMRLLIYQLRLPVLEQEGLVGAIQRRLEAVERRSGINGRILVEGTLDLPITVEEHLYRIIQEALNNALKHAQAGNVTVTIQAVGVPLTVEIADDGQGFVPDDSMPGVGMHSMRERVEQLGGTLEICSTPGNGTRVRVTLHQIEADVQELTV